MSLSNAYVQSVKKIPEVFNKIRDGQAPERFTNQLLKDWGFKSTNDRPFIPLLKSLGFLNADGVPTERYHDYRDHSRSGIVMAEALKEAYEDLFLISASPNASEKAAYQGKFKSFHNTSDNVAGMMTNTFLKLVEMADFDNVDTSTSASVSHDTAETEKPKHKPPQNIVNPHQSVAGLHYNIQIHLPATKDLEVYNAIFKSLKEHLID
ncbi:MAG: DUF5343 domain-containing protein [Alcanivorax sp.]